MTRLIIKETLFLLISVSLGIKILSQPTTVPVSFPTGGFRIDGFLQRQGEAGDWLAGPGGNEPGTFLLNDAGEPQSRFPFAHYFDLWNNDSDNVFKKAWFGQNPNDMKWELKRAQSKGDINHILAYLGFGPNEIWLFFAGDRLNRGGTAYLDFELLQKAVVKVGNQNSGGFYSFGQDGGRTVGDLLISVKFDNGIPGSNVKIYRWEPSNAPGGFAYIQIMGLPPGYVYSVTNPTEINVPFGAFGSTTYPAGTFMEAAIIAPLTFSCSAAATYGTSWIQSKSNDSYAANLIDFVETSQLPSSQGNSSSVNYFFYDLQHAQLTANVSPGTVDDYNFFWLPITPLTGSLSNPNIHNPVFTAGINDYCLSYIYELYVYRKSDGCLISVTPVVLDVPCKIGKPINPDQMHQSETFAEENSNTEDLLNVFPNPARSASIITLGGNNDLKDIHLIDMNGSIVQRWPGITTNTLQLKNLPSGIYLLKVLSRSTGKTATKKIMLNR